MMKYFSINELCRSTTAQRKGIDNTPNLEQIENLTNLVNHVLDPLREAFGKPIYVNSGFRCRELNKAVGGAKNSYHLRGMAADIDTHNYQHNKWLYNYIKQNLPYVELIWENGGEWIHVAFNKTKITQ